MRYPGVKRLRSGKYLVRATGTCPKTGKRKDTEKVVEAKNMAAAFQVREEIRIELQSSPGAPPSRLRLAEYAESWITSKLRELKPSTRRHYASVLDCHILPALGAILTRFERHEPRWDPMLVTLTFTACRFGEIAALTWGDLDLKHGEIIISKSSSLKMFSTPSRNEARTCTSVMIPFFLMRPSGSRISESG